MIKRKIIILTISIFFFLNNNILAQDKIAFIDLNYIYSNSKVGLKINKEIKKKQKIINKEFADFKKKLDEEKKNLLAQKNVLSEEEFKKKLSQLEKNLTKYNSIIAKKNKDLIDYQKKVKKNSLQY